MLGPVVLDLQGTSLSADEALVLVNPYVGGVILFSRNFQSGDQIAQLIKDIRSVRSGLLICVDQEGGRVQRFRTDFTRLPPLQKLGNLYRQNTSKALFAAHKCAWLMASELRAVDVDISFAPVVDADDGFSDVIGDRSFAKDFHCVTALGKAYIQGMHDAGMAATLKHFPGHGSVRHDSHVCQPVDFRTLNEVENSDMLPFISLAPLAGGVMPAHIRYELIDEFSVGFSPFWLQTILREKLRFNGIIFSDDLSMEGASVAGDHLARAKAALTAGCDAILICNNPVQAAEILVWLAKCNWPITGRLAQLKSKDRSSVQGLHALKSSSAWLSAVKTVKQLEG